MRKAKILLSCLLCFVFVLASGLVGCESYTYKKTELPHYSYASGERTDDYNSKLFYRNDYDVPLGDPTTIYIDEGPYAGNFYSTGTLSGAGFEILKSTDFVNWEIVGEGFVPDLNNYGSDRFWAPQLLYDKDALWSDYNIEAEEGESGKGLFFLFYSARTGEDEEKYDTLNYYLGVSISKTPEGPYKEFTGTNRNGFEMTAADPVFYLENINPETGINLDEGKSDDEKLYKERRSFIDACPFIAPDGQKYLYMVRSRNNDTSNEVWGVKMKDWVTPDYSTVTRLTSFGYTTTEKTEEYNFSGYTMKIDEGPYVYYHEGKYYLTFSIGSTKDKLYPVAQAIADSPLGPYTKIQPEDGGLVCSPGTDWDIHSSGHHSFFEVGDELWIVYHSYPVLGMDGIGDRAQCFERVYFTTNSKGQTVMHCNGPTNSYQPKIGPDMEYKNIAGQAKVKATNVAEGSSANLLTDGVIKIFSWDEFLDEFTTDKKGKTTVTLTFDDYVTVRALMVYNSYDYNYHWESIERVEMDFTRTVNGSTVTGTAYIDDLKFDVNKYINKELEGEEFMRPGGAAIAEFDELKVKEIRLTFDADAPIAISEIYVLGK